MPREHRLVMRDFFSNPTLNLKGMLHVGFFGVPSFLISELGDVSFVSSQIYIGFLYLDLRTLVTVCRPNLKKKAYITLRDNGVS